jgi:hypothetical protein
VQVISYWNVPPEERKALGIMDGLIRFACGVEDTHDILADVTRALELTDVNKQYLKDSHDVCALAHRTLCAAWPGRAFRLARTRVRPRCASMRP